MYRLLTPIAAVLCLSTLHAACGPDTHRPTSADATGAPSDGRQATSLLGKPLTTPEIPDVRRGQLEADLELARRAAEANPSDETAAIWHGRRLAYLGRFTDAIAVYSKALETHPDSYRLLRHRGHRYITIRAFDKAAADLTRAWELAKDKPDAPEPDGQVSGPLADPHTTDKSNILFHLGLAHYLKGDFARAADAFGKRSVLTAHNERLNDDTLASFMYWHYLSLRRLGRDAEAKAVLADYHPRMQIRDNDAYFALLRAFTGDVPIEIFAPAADTTHSTNLAMAYGLGAYRLISGQGDDAFAMFSKLAANPAWPSFGVIAAEAEVARRQSAAVPTP